MPKPYPQEFRDDVVNVARDRGPGQSIKQIVSDFGIAESCLRNWMRQARRRGRCSARNNRGRKCRTARGEEADPVARAGERGAAPGRCLSVPGESAGKMRYRLLRELADDGIPVTVTCRVLKIARQPYYRWLQAPVTAADLTAAHGANALFDAHRDDPEFGYRYLHEEAAEAGQVLAGRSAWSICSQQGWWSAFGKKRAKNGKRPGPPVRDDLCAVVDEHGRTGHVFAAETANGLWLTDSTEHKTAEGKLYLCAIKDVFSCRIVGYSIDSRMKSRLAVQALENAVAMRGDVAGCVVHSDRRSQFRSRKFRRALGWHRMVGSMGRVWSSGDNAAMETFFALLQKNVLDRRSWTTREQLRIAMVTWIERTYHRRRHQARLGRLTPIGSETIVNTTVAMAA
ncbi:IS3 family transposase [Kocuria salsicia]|uniref:IS3 family transposase n=1 Tax=Kocuria salsicia TaxID=664639 RepID=UPI0033EA1614